MHGTAWVDSLSKTCLSDNEIKSLAEFQKPDTKISLEAEVRGQKQKQICTAR